MRRRHLPKDLVKGALGLPSTEREHRVMVTENIEILLLQSWKCAYCNQPNTVTAIKEIDKLSIGKNKVDS